MRLQDAMIAIVFAATGPAAIAGEQVLRLDPGATSVRFTLPATLHTVEGVVPLRSGDVVFDEQSGAASGQIVLAASGASSANRARDRKMHEVVLESERYPEFVFLPARIESKRESANAARVTLTGTLRIHGAEHLVAISANLVGDRKRIVAEGEITIPYVAWGMADPSALILRVAKEVRVRFSASGTLTPARTGSPE